MKNEYEINAAINAAELVASNLAADNAPVTLTNKTVIALIEGAKGNIERLELLEQKIEDIRGFIRKQ